MSVLQDVDKQLGWQQHEIPWLFQQDKAKGKETVDEMLWAGCDVDGKQ